MQLLADCADGYDETIPNYASACSGVQRQTLFSLLAQREGSRILLVNPRQSMSYSGAIKFSILSKMVRNALIQSEFQIHALSWHASCNNTPDDCFYYEELLHE
ncbi:MAG: hypothetical protein IV108_05810 [Burkholderiales bacterium]|nr:hypothetical protein [Burkholderiales bacterium]